MKKKIVKLLGIMLPILMLSLLTACSNSIGSGGNKNDNTEQNGGNDNQQKPDDEENQKPDDGEQNPDNGEQKPDDGENKNPDENNQKPDDGKVDIDNDFTPATGTETDGGNEIYLKISIPKFVVTQTAAHEWTQYGKKYIHKEIFTDSDKGAFVIDDSESCAFTYDEKSGAVYIKNPLEDDSLADETVAIDYFFTGDGEYYSSKMIMKRDSGSTLYTSWTEPLSNDCLTFKDGGVLEFFNFKTKKTVDGSFKNTKGWITARFDGNDDGEEDVLLFCYTDSGILYVEPKVVEVKDSTIEEIALSVPYCDGNLILKGELKQEELGKICEKINKCGMDISLNMTNCTGIEVIGGWGYFVIGQEWNETTSTHNLKAIYLPNSVQEIRVRDGRSGFSSCVDLETIFIPKNVNFIDIEEKAFPSRCEKLMNINVSPDNEVYKSIDGVLYSKDGETLISCPRGKTDVKIPLGVKTIGEYAFYYCENLTSITIPSGVKTIEDYAFANCENLTNITIPSGVETIGANAFYYCKNLTSITIPSEVETIGHWAFSYCDNLTRITIPSGVKSIGEHAFYNCDNLTSITIPSGVETIGDWAFSNCDCLICITIPSGVKTIGKYAFFGCRNLETIFYQGILDEWCQETLDEWYEESFVREPKPYIVFMGGGDNPSIEEVTGVKFDGCWNASVENNDTIIWGNSNSGEAGVGWLNLKNIDLSMYSRCRIYVETDVRLYVLVDLSEDLPDNERYKVYGFTGDFCDFEIPNTMNALWIMSFDSTTDTDRTKIIRAEFY